MSKIAVLQPFVYEHIRRVVIKGRFDKLEHW